MATSPEYADYVMGQLGGVGGIRHRKMFSGVGVYIDDTFCAIVGSSNRFYLRVGPSNLEDFKARSMPQFSGGKGKGMPYYEVPEDVLEDPPTLALWALKARDAALAAKSK